MSDPPKVDVIKQFVDLNDEFEKMRLSIGKRARKLLILTLKRWLINHPKKAWIRVEAHAVEEINADAVYFDCTSGTQDRQESDELELASLLWPHGYVIRQGFRVDSRMTVWSRGKIYSYTPKED